MGGRAAVGLDIGTSGVRAAELSLGKAGATLERFGQVALPLGAVRAGEVVDVDAVAGALKQLWQQAGFGTKKVAVGVANQKVVVRQVEVPWMEPDQLRKSLALQVADFVPMPLDQAILDFHALEEVTNDQGGRMLRILLVAAHREMVWSVVDAVRKAGLEPAAVDLTPFAVLRSLATGSGDSVLPPAEALVEVGASVTNIVLHQGGVPRFVRVLPMGGQDVTNAIAERLGVPLEQAEAAKQHLGMAPTAGAPLVDHPAARVLESAASAFIEEVRGSLDYYLASPDAVVLTRVVLSGGGSQLRGLPERLAGATRLPVVLGSPLPSLQLGRTGLSPEQLSFVQPLVTVPVGLAMGAAA